MARKSEPKPLFSLKEDFKDSLDHFCQQAIFLHQQVESAVQLGALDGNPTVKKLIQERLTAFRAAMVSDEY